MGCCAKTSSQTSSLQSKTSLATEKYLVAQVNTALVRAAYQGAVVEFATDTTRGATEVSQAIVAIIARLRSKNVTAPVAVGLLTTESVCVANERRLRPWRLHLIACAKSALRQYPCCPRWGRPQA